MEAYSNLVQDTKNGRLKFLLNETDSYISTINRMIQEQRVLTVEEVCFCIYCFCLFFLVKCKCYCKGQCQLTSDTSQIMYIIL